MRGPGQLPDVVVARIYDRPDGRRYRVLVDRLWPRGIARADAPIEKWQREIAPSAQLRKWYGHDPARFTEFAQRYRAELAERPPTFRFVRGYRQGGSGALGS